MIDSHGSLFLSCEAGSAIPVENCGPAGIQSAVRIARTGLFSFLLQAMLNGYGHRVQWQKNLTTLAKKPYYLLNGVEQRDWWVFGDFVGQRRKRAPLTIV